jgi:hypothetical protein
MNCVLTLWLKRQSSKAEYCSKKWPPKNQYDLNQIDQANQLTTEMTRLRPGEADYTAQRAALVTTPIGAQSAVVNSNLQQLDKTHQDLEKNKETLRQTAETKALAERDKYINLGLTQIGKYNDPRLLSEYDKAVKEGRGDPLQVAANMASKYEDQDTKGQLKTAAGLTDEEIKSKFVTEDAEGNFRFDTKAAKAHLKALPTETNLSVLLEGSQRFRRRTSQTAPRTIRPT